MLQLYRKPGERILIGRKTIATIYIKSIEHNGVNIVIIDQYGTAIFKGLLAKGAKLKLADSASIKATSFSSWNCKFEIIAPYHKIYRGEEARDTDPEDADRRPTRKNSNNTRFRNILQQDIQPQKTYNA